MRPTQISTCTFFTQKSRLSHFMEKMPDKQKTLPGFLKDDSGVVFVRTYKELADVFGLHIRTIKNWAARGMPVENRGKYDVNAIQTWAVNEGLIQRDKIGWSGKIQKEKYLHERAKRKEREFDLAVKSKKFIKIGDAKKELITMAQQVRMAILALPHKMAPLLEGLEADQIQKKLEFAVDEVLRHLSNVDDK